MKKIILFSLLLLLPLNGHAQSLTIDTLLDKMIEVYGGEAALEKADAYEQEWDITAMTSGEKGIDRRQVALPATLYTDLSYPTRSETRILIAGKGIKITNKTHQKTATGPMLDAMKLQLMRLYTPLTLRQNKMSLQLKAQQEHYTITFRQGSIVTDYYIDPQTYYIMKVVGTLSMGGRSMSFLTHYGDHKMVEGVLMHHSENKFAANVNTAVLHLKVMKFKTDEEPKNRHQEMRI